MGETTKIKKGQKKSIQSELFATKENKWQRGKNCYLWSSHLICVIFNSWYGSDTLFTLVHFQVRCRCLSRRLYRNSAGVDCMRAIDRSVAVAVHSTVKRSLMSDFTRYRIWIAGGLLATSWSLFAFGSFFFLLPPSFYSDQCCCLRSLETGSGHGIRSPLRRERDRVTKVANATGGGKRRRSGHVQNNKRDTAMCRPAPITE